MMKRETRVSAVLFAALAFAATGCGGGLSDEKRKDAAKALAAMNSTATGATLQLSGGERMGITGEVLQRAEGAAWLTLFKRDQHALASSCAAGTANGCTTTCPSTGVEKVSCSIPDNTEKSCSGTTYKFTENTFAVTVDSTGFSDSSGGTIKMSMNVATNISGGTLDGKKFACDIVIAMNLSSSSVSVTVDEGNFSCSYDGQDIDAEDFQSDLGQFSCG